MRVWRISKAKYAHSAFSGEGARLFDARWNFAGTPMVYTSTSLALAAIEFFVHLDPSEAPMGLVSLLAEMPDDVSIEQVEIRQLPRDWRKTDNRILQQIGTDWAKSQRSVALIVPSAVVEGEWNVLLNRGHPEFKQVRLGEPKPFHYDERMFR
ncbi:MAG: RES family NAD+ phosphorylase [Silvibacterium sp.]|nr:RES family NAD+ phosphorylase [Silvibacterium sp.]MBV8437884.1 RES family NAD+ phosphorylase [Silvibacterium sp.]